MRIAYVNRAGVTPHQPSVTAGLLAERGHEVVTVPDRSFAAEAADVVWLAGSLNGFPRTLRRLARAARRPRTVVWHTEPLPLPAEAGLGLERLHVRELAKVLLRDPRRTDPRSNAAALRRAVEAGLVDVLAVSTGERQRYLAELGIEAAFVPMGYYPEVGRDLGLERDIDVLFLGARDVPRRARILERLERAGIAVVARGGWEGSFLGGEERARLLNRAKIVLNLPRHAGLLSGFRMVLAMANKALVVAEPIFDPRPYRPGVHYVSAALDAMPETIRRYLESDDERRAIVEEAAAFVTTEVTHRRAVETLAAAVERAEDASAGRTTAVFTP